MNKALIFILVILLSGLYSCKTSEKSANSEPKPDWVSKRPSSSMHYVGIGAQKKAGLSPSAYTQNAKSSALNDLASDISVNISSRSVMSTLETDYDLKENYQRTIKATTDKRLQGYEIVDTWNGENYYWVYMRLSKSKYKQQKLDKKKSAIKKAKEKYKQAHNQRENDNFYQAINSYINAFTDLSAYLGENTYTTIDSTNIDIGTLIYRELVETINRINITSPENSLFITSGKVISSELLNLRVTDNQKSGLSNIPIKLSFTGSGLMDNSIKSNQAGFVSIPLNKIYSDNQVEKLTAKVDMIKISRLTKNIFIRKLVKKIPPPSYTLKFRILSPKMFVETNEKSFGKNTQRDDFYNAIMQAVAHNKMRVADSREKADFILQLSSDTEKAVTNSYQKTVFLNYVISVKNDNQRMVYRKEESEIEGFGNTYKKAEQNAINNGVNRIKRKNFNQLNTSVFEK